MALTNHGLRKMEGTRGHRSMWRAWHRYESLEEMAEPGTGGTAWNRWQALAQLAVPGTDVRAWCKYRSLEQVAEPG